jgi:hypothetical protein
MFQWLKNTTRTSGTRRRASYRPTIEGLEARECMSTAVSLVGHTLNIIGDNSADKVTVTLRDSVNDIQVNCNERVILSPVGYPRVYQEIDHFSSSQVQKINVDLKGGDDQLFIQLGFLDNPALDINGDPSMAMFDPKNIVINLGDGANQAELWFGGFGYANRTISTNLNITVNAGDGIDSVIANFGEMQQGTLRYNAFLGAGDDQGFVGIWGSIDAGAAVHVNLQGQAGNDNLNTFETFAAGYDSVNIAAGALLDINVGGGAGNDSMYLVYGGNVLGKLRIRQDGGIGNDGVGGEIHLAGQCTGAVDAVFSGGDGRDDRTLDLSGVATTLRALIDGGDGFFDRASSTGDVTIINAISPPTTVSPR